MSLTIARRVLACCRSSLLTQCGYAAGARARTDARSLRRSRSSSRRATASGRRRRLTPIVLFDGKDLSQWVSQYDGTTGRPPWVVVDGAMQRQAEAAAASSRSRRSAACQLHIEFATPSVVEGQQPGPRQQRRVPDEQLRDAGARLVSEPDVLPRPGRRHLQAARAAREPEPQARRVATSTTIVFHAPKFDADGKLLKRATFTVVSQRRPGPGPRRA